MSSLLPPLSESSKSSWSSYSSVMIDSYSRLLPVLVLIFCLAISRSVSSFNSSCLTWAASSNSSTTLLCSSLSYSLKDLTSLINPALSSISFLCSICCLTNCSLWLPLSWDLRFSISLSNLFYISLAFWAWNWRSDSRNDPLALSSAFSSFSLLSSSN